MTNATRHQDRQPIWARPTAFEPAPRGYGWVDAKGRHHQLESREHLLKALSTDRAGEILLVWSPDDQHMVLPEELEGAAQACLLARRGRVAADFEDSALRLKWMLPAVAALALYLLWKAWQVVPAPLAVWEHLLSATWALLKSATLGMALLMLLVFAFIPWYQSRKRMRELAQGSDDDAEDLIPVLRFETWLGFQKAPVTLALAAMMVVVGAAQLAVDHSIQSAGLVKPAYWMGEKWRLLTAPWLHGNLIHFVMNGLALIYLGKRVEVFARWPHLLLVLLFSSLAGGMLSARFLEAPSVGISGGLMGWLGFLLVFESLHARLVPSSARRRLLGGVLLTALIGILGYRFIDNAAHAGGLIAGVIYGVIVFPKSASINRPSVLGVDRIAGIAAAVLLVCSVVLVVVRLLDAS